MDETKCLGCPSYQIIGCWDGHDRATGKRTHGFTYGCTNPICGDAKKTEEERHMEILMVYAKNKENGIDADDFAAARKAAGVTIRQAATYIGVTFSTYSDWEKQRKEIPREAYEKLTEFFRDPGRR